FLYMLGKEFFGQEKSMWLRPFQTTAIAGIFVISIALTYKWHTGSINFEEWFTGIKYSPMATWINFAVLLLALIATKVLAIRFWNQKKQINYFLLNFPIFMLISILIAKSGGGFWARIFFNAYIFVWGLYYVNEGIKHHLVALVNAGTFFLATLLIVRFFDSGLDFLLKGIAFIVIGIGFLAVNYVLSKRLKHAQELKVSEE
ncbi:MAG: hypothetical protein ACPGVB_15195, partial [Chitinophagales bacterium]